MCMLIEQQQQYVALSFEFVSNEHEDQKFNGPK